MITRALERRAKWQTGLSLRDPALVDLFGRGGTSSGSLVTPTTAMQLMAVLACVRLLSETMAGLPLPVYKYLPDGDREPDPSQPIYPLLKTKPNNWQTSFEFREYCMHSLLLRGFSASEIFPTADGYPFGQLIPLHPDRVKPFRAPDGSRCYEYRDERGSTRVILQEEMLFVPFLPDNGYTAVSVIKHMAEFIGQSLTADRYSGSVLSEDSSPGGYLEHPGTLSLEAQQRLIATWEARHKGADKKKRLAILEEGMKFQTVNITPEDAELLATRGYNGAQIAQGFGIPPHMIGLTDRTTSWGTGIEQMGIGFVIYTMRSLLIRWEQAIMRDLFTEAGRKTHFAEFNVDGLLRGDQKTRYEGYAIGKNAGFLTTNRILRLENMNTVGPEGDVYYQPLNMAPAAKDGLTLTQRIDSANVLIRVGFDPADALKVTGLPPMQHTGAVVPTKAPVTAADNTGRAARLRTAYEPVFAEAALRAFRRVENRRGTPDELRAIISRTMAPIVRSYAELVTEQDAETFAEAYLAGLADRMYEQNGDPVVKAETRARWEVVQEAGAAMRHALKGKRARWVRGDDCAFCGELEGRTVGEEPFIRAGEKLEAAGVTFEAGQDFHHPPIHEGCTCSIEEDSDGDD